MSLWLLFIFDSDVGMNSIPLLATYSNIYALLFKHIAIVVAAAGAAVAVVTTTVLLCIDY